MKINITLPCYNEAKILKNNVLALANFLEKNIPQEEWQIIIADNNSSDNTREIAQKLIAQDHRIKYIFIPRQGKGLAIKGSWEKFSADIYIFMDADLATDLSSLPNLINGIKKEKYNLVIGSRFLPSSQVKRTFFRRFLSWGFKILRQIILRSRLSDTPCGFKAIDQKTKKTILPLVQDKQWFFDSELVLLAEKRGLFIKEIPVKWEDIREKQDKSRVKTISLSLKYFKDILKLKIKNFYS